MSKFNVKGQATSSAPTSYLRSEQVTSGQTHEGAPGFARDAKSELFLFAVSDFVEDTFYESKDARAERYRKLIGTVAVADPDWTGRFLMWLRNEANMRSVAIVGGLEAAAAMVKANIPGSRALVNGSLQRADEPGEALAYWFNRYGRKMPKPVKRGIADAAQRLYTEYATLKYDTASKGFRFADVLDLTHARAHKRYDTIADLALARSIPMELVEQVMNTRVHSILRNLPDDAPSRMRRERAAATVSEWLRKPQPSLTHGWRSQTLAGVLGITELELLKALRPRDTWQGDLYKFALARRHNRDGAVNMELLPMTAQNSMLREAVAEGQYNLLLDPACLKAAGFTWEDALSLAGDKVNKAQLWEAMIPSMGYMALLRNLANFDRAGISAAVAQDVMARLTDPTGVAKSKQFPFRFLSAYRAVPSLWWQHSLEVALNLSLSNVPILSGSTLVLVDRSGSMFDRPSDHSKLSRADQAAVFGAALALRNLGRTTLVQFGTTATQVPVKAGDSLLRIVNERFGNLGGTYTDQAVRAFYRNHDRVVIITDEQAHYHSGTYVGSTVPARVPMYTWNLAGYKYGQAPVNGNRHTFGGLTDQAFKLIQFLEQGESQTWPF